ncbi:MAG: prepilin-type N-terminal cleavage/methylation domain-containing protein [bacterium]
MLCTNDTQLKPVNHREIDGFTLIELLIVLIIFPIILLAGFKILISQNRIYNNEQEVNQMYQNTRITLDLLYRELRMSGYQALEGSFLNNLSDWIPGGYIPTAPSSVDLSSATCPIITKGSGANPDMITIFMADTMECKLSSGIAIGANQITIDPNSNGYQNAYEEIKFIEGDIIRIGDYENNSEFAKVVSVDNTTLTIDTEPATTSFDPVTMNHDAGEVVREINVITYALFNKENDSSCQHHKAGHPVLYRKHNVSQYENVCDDVENLKITINTPPIYQLHLLTRTSKKGNYVGAKTDGYKKTELFFNFQVRNSLKSNCPAPAAPASVDISGLDAQNPCEIIANWSEVTKDINGEDLAPECAVARYIISYDNTEERKFYTAYPENNTYYTLDVSSISDPNKPIYYISVAACNNVALSPYTNETQISDSKAPDPNIDLLASAGENSIDICWTAYSECDVKEYRIYRSLTSGGPYDDLLYTDSNIKTGFSTYTYQDTNIIPCCIYYYIVRAFDNTYESPDSNESSCSIDSNTPEGPSNFTYTPMWDVDTSLYLMSPSWELSVDDQGNAGEECGAQEPTYYIYELDEMNNIIAECQSVPAGQNSATFSVAHDNIGIKFKNSCGIYSDLVTLCEENHPFISIDSFSSEADGPKTITIQGTVNQVSTLDHLGLQINNENWINVGQISGNSWSYIWNSSQEMDGRYRITARVVNIEGCSADATHDIDIQNGVEDYTPPSFGNIIKTPEDNPVAADQSVQICVKVTDPLNISDVTLQVSTDYSESDEISMNDLDEDEIYCCEIDPYNGREVYYTIEATDNSFNQNLSSISSGYEQHEGEE